MTTAAVPLRGWWNVLGAILLAACVLPGDASAQSTPRVPDDDPALFMAQIGRRALPPLLHYIAAGSDVAQPALAPDNQQVVFVRSDDTGTDVFTMPITGTAPVNLTNSPDVVEETPIFAPDGASVVFAARGAAGWDIFAVDRDGANLRPLVADPAGDELHPAFTADGTRLYFSSNRAGGNWDIYTAPVAGGPWTRLTTTPAIDRFPVVSQGGAAVVFRREDQGVSNLWAMAPNGTDQRPLTQGAGFALHPAASPAHRGIVYVAATALQLTNTGGGPAGPLMPDATWPAETPRLSYDGRWLIYVATVEGVRSIVFRPFDAPLLAVGQRGFDRLAGECGWEAGTLAWGWVRAWQATADPRYFDWIKHWVDGCLAGGAQITHVNDVPLAYAAMVVNARSPAQKYLDIASEAAGYLFDVAPRASNGALIHLDAMVWDDTLMAVIPFLTTMWSATGEDRYLAEAIGQVLRHADLLQDPDTGLFHHAWSEPAGGFSGPFFWGRGNGWALAAMADLLRALPVDDARRPLVLDRFHQLAAAVVKLQDAGGLWHTVLTRPDFYLETSGSALLAGGLVEGVKAGWIDASFAAAAGSAQTGVWGKVAAGGAVAGVSGPTGPMLEEAAYNGIVTRNNYTYGQGVVLLLGAAEAIP